MREAVHQDNASTGSRLCMVHLRTLPFLIRGPRQPKDTLHLATRDDRPIRGTRSERRCITAQVRVPPDIWTCQFKNGSFFIWKRRHDRYHADFQDHRGLEDRAHLRVLQTIKQDMDTIAWTLDKISEIKNLEKI